MRTVRHGPGPTSARHTSPLPSPVWVDPSFVSHAGNVSRRARPESKQSGDTSQANVRSEISAEQRGLQRKRQARRPASAV